MDSTDNIAAGCNRSGSQDVRERLIEELRHHQFELEQQNEELRRTYNSLNRATMRFESLWEAAPIGYITHERNGVIIAANKRASQILSRSGQVTSTSTIYQFLDEDSRQVLRQHLWCIPESTSTSSEIRLATPPETAECWLRIESCFTSEAECRSALIDISAQKAAETEQQALVCQLRQTQKMDLLNELCTGIIHDFNNYLQAIMASGEAIRKQLFAADCETQGADALLKAANCASDVTRRLLAFSRRTPLKRTPCDVRKVVDNVVSIAQHSLGDCISVRCMVPDDPLIAKLDSGLIEQVLFNLCVNARDAMPDGGRLTLELREIHFDRPRWVQGFRIPSGQYVEISVIDDGIGMGDETAKRVFEPFFTTKAEGHGTGLGLAIAYGIIEQHDGAIDVVSRPGFGSEFTILFPMCDATTDSAQTVGPLANQSAAGATILLAEDREIVRDSVAAVLRAAGFEVLTAVNGEHAVALLDTHPEVDLLLSDVMMPGKNGDAVCEWFHARYPNRPVIFLTSHAGDLVNEQFIELHQATLLEKPVSHGELLSAVASRLTMADRASGAALRPQ